MNWNGEKTKSSTYLLKLTLLGLALVLFSCGGQRQKGQLVIHASSITAPIELPGGLHLIAKDLITGQTIKAEIDETLIVTIPYGPWLLYVVGWQGPIPLTGDIKCGGQELILDAPSVNLSLTLNDANCDHELPLRLIGQLIGVDQIPNSPPLQDVCVASNHTCALGLDGQVKCWGDNTNGELGQEDTAQRGDTLGDLGDSLSYINLGTTVFATKIACGGNHNCALIDNGQVKCWGSNSSGQLGHEAAYGIRGGAASEMGDSLPYVPSLTNIIDVCVGSAHSCALNSSGNVYCWGSNTYGQLGQENTTNLGTTGGDISSTLTGSPINLGTARTATRIACGDNHNCAILDDGTLKCWGRNNSGQLGAGSSVDLGDSVSEMGDNLVAVSLGGTGVPVDVALGTSHTCVVMSGGEVKCFGSSISGQLGIDGVTTVGTSPGDMGNNLQSALLPATFAAIHVSAAAAGTSCAWDSIGKAYCWGGGGAGQLGHSLATNIGNGGGVTSMSTIKPMKLGPGQKVRKLVMSTHGCALLQNDHIRCWGNNANGQLGLEDADNRGDDLFEMGAFLDFVDLGTY